MRCLRPITSARPRSWSGSACRGGRIATDFGPFVIARGVLEPQDRWVEFLRTSAHLVRRFNPTSDGTAKIRSDYFVIRIER